MSFASRAARCARVMIRVSGSALRTLALVLLLLVAALLPAPILGRLGFERPERRNGVSETRRRR